MTGTAEAAAPPESSSSQRSAVRTLLRLWPFVRPVRARLLTTVLVAVLAACTGLVIPLVLKWMVDGPVAEGDSAGIWLGGAYLLLLGVAEAGLSGLRRWLVARPLAAVEASMRDALYRRVQRLPMSFHDSWSSGQLLSRGTTDLNLIRMFLTFPLTFLVVNGLTILIGYVILLGQSWTLGLVLLTPVPPLLVLCSVFEARYRVASRQAQDQLGDLTTLVEESVLGIRIIKGFGRHRSQARSFTALARRVRSSELRKTRLMAAIWVVSSVLPELAVGVALVLGTMQVADGALSAGTMVAFLSTVLALRWPTESIGSLLAMSNEAAAATERYFEVMDRRTEREEAEAGAATQGVARDAADVVKTFGARGGTGSGELVFDGLEFRYPDAPQDAPATLRGIDLRIRPGETMALVGATGSGKTTLTALVPRLYEPTGGRILLDGQDTASLTWEELRTLVGVAFEEATLFSTTVAENVLMGGDGLTDTDLLRALEVAQAHEFVSALPHGPRTEVGEQGLSLSGGQRQRLALARAVAARPRYLILDDPLSALDIRTEAMVEEALRRVLADTTALVVAHRPSTVLLADRVALLSGGRITAVGTHHELLRDNAEYAALMAGGPAEPAAARTAPAGPGARTGTRGEEGDGVR
ncbi:ABC transporter ATP-binding protein [Streptomyces sp. NPDC059002]|uniref:ABC transporter ATP-binding protein n=1 Tax=Streptomyces sp. NPDC059002 TaxID=3346690 RepID=UPI0036861F0E